MFSPFNNNQNQQQNQGPKLPKCDQFFASVPFGCLVFYFILVGFWIIDLFTDIGHNYLINNYQKTIYSVQLWRLVTSAFIESSLLMICFIILNFQTFLPSLEIRKGSSFLIIDLLTRNIKLQLILLLIQYIASIVSFDLIKFNNSGASCLWFNYMMIFCWLNPKQMKLCCFNIKFNRKFYPIIFAIIITLFNWQIKGDIFVAIIIGLLQATVLKNIPDLLQTNHYQLINNVFTKLRFSSFKNWISLNPSRLSQKICTSNVYSNLEFQQNQLLSTNDQIDNRSTKSTSHSQKNQDHFSNLKGVRLGDY